MCYHDGAKISCIELLAGRFTNDKYNNEASFGLGVPPEQRPALHNWEEALDLVLETKRLTHVSSKFD